MKALKITAVMLTVCFAAVVFAGCSGKIDNPKLTLTNYNQLVIGTTTVAQAKALLGEPQVTNEVGAGSLAITQMVWSNHKNTAKATVVVTLGFNNDVLSTKVHIGLT